ncbi:hypothetical protein RJT34_26313 [Clitoria ternatea]|uniref:Uncharacterized protein n=1 Tax=Clitoria ternatea TaxID=43366 RepID=A0AAN9I924_CLITE
MSIIIVLFFLLSSSSSSMFHTASAQPRTQLAAFGESEKDNTNATLLMLLVVFIFGFFITGLCSIFICYCSEEYTVPQNPSRAHAIDARVLAALPIMPFSAVMKHIKTGRNAALQCAVCLGEFTELDALRLLPSENGEGTVMGNGNGDVGKGDGSSKVKAFGVLVRSHSTGIPRFWGLYEEKEGQEEDEEDPEEDPTFLVGATSSDSTLEPSPMDQLVIQAKQNGSQSFLCHIYRYFSFGETEDYAVMSPKGKGLHKAASEAYHSRKYGRADSSNE